jgi:hypothetical protein
MSEAVSRRLLPVCCPDGPSDEGGVVELRLVLEPSRRSLGEPSSRVLALHRSRRWQGTAAPWRWNLRGGSTVFGSGDHGAYVPSAANESSQRSASFSKVCGTGRAPSRCSRASRARQDDDGAPSASGRPGEAGDRRNGRAPRRPHAARARDPESGGRGQEPTVRSRRRSSRAYADRNRRRAGTRLHGGERGDAGLARHDLRHARAVLPAHELLRRHPDLGCHDAALRDRGAADPCPTALDRLGRLDLGPVRRLARPPVAGSEHHRRDQHDRVLRVLHPHGQHGSRAAAPARDSGSGAPER